MSTFINPNEKGALLAITNLEVLETVRAACNDLGFRHHAVYKHGEFHSSFTQAEYKLVMIDELFDCTSPAENRTLTWLQRLPMPSRRHATLILLGKEVESLQSMQAFQKSVHAVVNYAELPSIDQIIQKVVSDNESFLHPYLEAAARIAEGRA